MKINNSFKIAPKVSILVNNLLIRRCVNFLSRNFATHQEKPSKRRVRKDQNNVTESILVAMTAIKANRLTKNVNKNTLHLLDESTAKKFASLVAANRTPNSTFVVEINSGLGFLTKELLNAGIPSVQMFEGTKDFWPGLLELVDKYPNRLLLKNIDFLKLCILAQEDSKATNIKLDSYFDEVDWKKWEEEPAINVIGSLANKNFLNNLIMTLPLKNRLINYGKTILYVALPPSIWAELTCSIKHYDLYRTQAVLFQTLFRYELLGSLPRSHFYPTYKLLDKRSFRCRVQIREDDKSIMHVVKIQAKPDIFEDNFTESDVMQFLYFVKHHLKARSNRVIPALENWIPGCGRTLIAQGFNIFTEFGELSPHEILKLFKEFKSWPEYNKSTFISCMDTFLMKMDEHILFDSSSEEIDDMFQSSINTRQYQDEITSEKKGPGNSAGFDIFKKMEEELKELGSTAQLKKKNVFFNRPNISTYVYMYINLCSRFYIHNMDKCICLRPNVPGDKRDHLRIHVTIYIRVNL